MDGVTDDPPVLFVLAGIYRRRPTKTYSGDSDREPRDRAYIRPYSTDAEPHRRGTAADQGEGVVALFAGCAGDGEDAF